MMRPRLFFVSPRFIFPTDSGGKIRTYQILKGLKGGAFEITVASPASPLQLERYRHDLQTISDQFISWGSPRQGHRSIKLRFLMSGLPLSVAADRNRGATRLIEEVQRSEPCVTVFDFVHSAVFSPTKVGPRRVVFAHNVEAEIYARHAEVAHGCVRKAIWRNQYRKMLKFEQNVLANFDGIIAVSERDKIFFETQYGLRNVKVIPTGVDVNYFDFNRPEDDQRVVFCGSMDWMANIDALDFFLTEVWPCVQKLVPQATMTVVGRDPPSWLVTKARNLAPRWRFTGYVDDIRPFARGAAAFVIPLRVGGGTRIKAFEAMALGCPVVSTSIGVEGLPVQSEQHYLAANSPTEMAKAIVELLRSQELRDEIAFRARRLVEDRFNYQAAAKVFEGVCAEIGGIT